MNSSSMVTLLGLRAFGLNACKTSMGAMEVRDQYEILEKWNGNQRGNNMISTGISGNARQDTMPNSASRNRVNTLAPAAPPRARIASRARRMWSASGESPIILSAK